MLSSNPLNKLQSRNMPAVNITLSDYSLLKHMRTKARFIFLTFLDQTTNQSKSEGVSRQACGIQDTVWDNT